jgi:hypothetical protein
MSADDAADAAAEEYVDPAYTLEDADWVPGAGEAGADDGAIVIEVEWDGIESMGHARGSDHRGIARPARRPGPPRAQ